MKNQLKKLKEHNDELEPLNNELYSEFSIQELEQRLETKPWICGAYQDCPQLTCNVDNTPPAVA
jgi:hypothetical protein